MFPPLPEQSRDSTRGWRVACVDTTAMLAQSPRGLDVGPSSVCWFAVSPLYLVLLRGSVHVPADTPCPPLPKHRGWGVPTRHEAADGGSQRALAARVLGGEPKDASSIPLCVYSLSLCVPFCTSSHPLIRYTLSFTVLNSRPISVPSILVVPCCRRLRSIRPG